MAAGHILERGDIEIKSPGDGLAPYELKNVLGKKLRKPMKKDDTILFEGIERV
jgi:N-acetylneuraminate synthase/sialic acid synthase